MNSSPKPLDNFLHFAPPLIGDEEISEVIHTLKSGWLTTGPKTERFEKQLADVVGAGATLAVNSCTAALHLGVCALELGPGHGVITTVLTFASTAHSVLYQGARPFFVDIEPETGNLSPKKVRDFLETQCAQDAQGQWCHKVTGDIIKAILPVHYGGHPADLKALWDIATQFGLNMLEDGAHSLGATYEGLPLGHQNLKPACAMHLQSLAAFSFYATKNMTTGEGGFLAATDPKMVEKARVLSMYGISDSRRIWGRYAPQGTWVYDVAHLGFKYNMMDIQASIGLHQLPKLNDFIRVRRNHAAIYREAFADLADMLCLPWEAENVTHAWHLYGVRLKPDALTIGRDEFIELLRAHNIGSSVLFIPLHYHSYYRKTLAYEDGDFPVAEKFFKNLINLPLAPAHSPERISEAAHLITTLLKKYKR
ncbi:MAG: DegT/DnrJ/EryC1/StrS family aminotransferase [Candidatus Adiutrix sp.]